ncbi:MAG: hypothetical protein AAF802_24375 [Planctomycetota bacterium]
MTSTSIPDVLPDLLERITTNPLETAIEFYAARLPLNPKAVAFVESELGLTPEQAAKERIGFSDRRLAKTFPSTDSKAGRDLREHLKAIGLFKSSGHEALRGCITIPLFDDNGNVTGILGRRIDRKVKADDIIIGSGTSQLSTLAPLAPLAGRGAGGEGQSLDDNTAKDTESTKEDRDLLIEDHQIIFTRDDRRYRIRGLEKNNAVGSLKVNILASRDDMIHLDAIDLVKARSRASFIKATAAELFVDADLIKRDIGQLLLKLEALQEQRIAEAKAPKVRVVELTEREREEALALLRSPDLLERIVADMDACGMVGESTNKLVGYLAATSRKLKTPLAIVIQSSSSAGKTSLMDAVLNMMPTEETIRYSGMTGQSLFYLDSGQIKHNILAISEDEGIREATYALKLLQSEGELRQAVTTRGKDGRMTTETYHVEGPVMIMLTTTAMDIDEELINRCLVLTVDETRMQTGAILVNQRLGRKLESTDTRRQAGALRRLHQNAQRLLRNIEVKNPYADQLTFPTDKTRMRRDHQKYLTLIEVVALLHQHQRTIKTYDNDGETAEYINVERSDIEVANTLAAEILGQSLDELAPQTRTLLGLLHEFVGRESRAHGVSRHAFRFTRRDVRQSTGWSDTQLHRHLTRLVELEYILIHRGKRGRRFVYELIYNGEGDGNPEKPFLMGLRNPADLQTPPTLAADFQVSFNSLPTSRARKIPRNTEPNHFLIVKQEN